MFLNKENNVDQIIFLFNQINTELHKNLDLINKFEIFSCKIKFATIIFSLKLEIYFHLQLPWFSIALPHYLETLELRNYSKVDIHDPRR